MTHNRYNAFNQIHKGLRAMLYNTALQIQQTDFDQKEEVTPLLDQIQQLVHFFDEHAEHEDRFILPAIAAYNTSFIDAFEKEHEEDCRLSAQLLNNISTWQQADDNEERLAAGQTLFLNFNEFLAFNLYHMNREETVLNELIWENYTDEEILQIQAKLIATIPPEVMYVESQWMMRGISNREIINWLKGIQQTAPAHVFQSFFEMAETELPPNRFSIVSKAFSRSLEMA